MIRHTISLIAPLLLVFLLHARDELNQDELKMLQDPGGWEYVSVTDPDDGIQTTHTCFDGQPHPETCSGNLTLNADGTFTQKVYIHGHMVERQGKYELNDTEITFADEFGTKDGPYSLQINTQSKRMTLQITQSAGTLVRVELELEKQYRKDRVKHG